MSDKEKGKKIYFCELCGERFDENEVEWKLVGGVKKPFCVYCQTLCKIKDE